MNRVFTLLGEGKVRKEIANDQGVHYHSLMGALNRYRKRAGYRTVEQALVAWAKKDSSS